MEYYKKGGTFRYVMEGVADSDTFEVPAGCKIVGAIAQVTGGADPVTVSIGTAEDGTQIVNAGSAAVGLTILTVATSVYSMTATQTAWITAVPGAGQVLNLFILMEKIN